MRLILFALSILAGFPLARLMLHPLRVLGFARTNFQGRSIRTAGGLLFLIAALPWLWIRPDERTVLTAAAAVGFGLLGFIDDRWGSGEFRGLHGHLAALRRGRLTTGLLKAGGGLALGGWLGWRLSPPAGALVAALLIALSA